MVDNIEPPYRVPSDAAGLEEQLRALVRSMFLEGKEALAAHLESDSERSVKRLLNGVNDTSGAARSAWLFFLALMAYFFVALATVADRDLLLNSPVQLPIVNIAIPLTAFFLFGPLVLLLAHFGILMQHVVLARKAHALDHCLSDEKARGDLDEQNMRFSLNSYFFTQKIAGKHGWLHNSIFAFIGFLSFLGLPILLLVVFQTKFLAYHEPGITWAHRAYLCADVLFILLFISFFGASRQLGSKLSWHDRFKRAGRGAVFGLRAALLLVILFWSFCVATLPDQWMERKIIENLPDLMSVPVANPGSGIERRAFFLTAYFLETPVNQVKGRSGSFFNRNLVVTDDRRLVAVADRAGAKNQKSGSLAASSFAASSLAAADGGGRGGKAGGAMAAPTLALRGRDLRYATLDRSNLRGVDLTGANLAGASLRETDLTGARFACAKKPRFNLFGGDYDGCATLKNAALENAMLAGADFENADLSHALLSHAILTRAILRRANLSGADVSFARLNGADLTGANLSGANLIETRLIGAKLNFAILRGATLLRARLTGADMTLARAEGATLRNANLQGANLTLAHLQGADLSTAQLEAANLRHARLQGVDMTAARLTLADLTSAKLQGAKLTKVAVNGTDFSRAELWGTVPPGSFVRGGPLMSGLAFERPQQRERSVIEKVRRSIEPKVALTNRAAVLRLRRIADQFGFLDWDQGHPDAIVWQCLRKLARKHDCNDSQIREAQLHNLMANFACFDTSASAAAARALLTRVVTTGTWTRKEEACAWQSGKTQPASALQSFVVIRRQGLTARRLISRFLTIGKRSCDGIVRLAKRDPALIEKLLTLAGTDLQTLKRSANGMALDFWGDALKPSEDVWKFHQMQITENDRLIKLSAQEQKSLWDKRKAVVNFRCSRRSAN